MRSALLAVLALAALAAGPRAAPAEDPPASTPRTHVVFVPEEDMDVLFGGKRTMLLDWVEYLGLRHLAARNPEESTAPAAAVFRRAEFTMKLDGERAVGEGRLDLSVLRDGLHRVPLPLAGVGVTSATLDGKPATLGRDRGGAFLALEGRGDHRLELALAVRVDREDGDRFRLRATLPPAARGFLELRLEGRQEVTSAVSAHRAVYPKTEDATVVGVHLDATGSVDLRWHPRHDGADRLALLHANVIQTTLVEDDAVRVDAVVACDVYRRPIDRLELTLPAGVTLADVRATGLLDWADAVAGDVRTVTLRFDAPFTGRRGVRLTGELAFPGAGEMDVPLVTVSGAARLTGRIGLAYGADLAGRIVAAEGVQRMDPFARGDTSVESYVFWNASRRLRLRIERPPLRVKASVRTLLQLGESSRVIDAALHYEPTGGRVYDFSPALPEEFAITHVMVNGSATGFTWEDAGGGRLRVLVPAGFGTGETARLRIRAERPDETWRDGTAREATVSIPAIDAGDGVETTGILGVAAFSDFDVRDEGLVGYEPVSITALAGEGVAAVNPVLAYRYRGAPGTGTLRVIRREAKIVAGVTTLVAPSREVILVRARVSLELVRAGIRQVKIRVGGGFGDAVHVTGPGVQSATRVRDRETGADVWTVVFRSLRHDEAALDLVLEQKADGLFAVPEITVLDVADQAGWTAVESSPGLEIRLAPTGLVEIEAEEVPLPPGYGVAHGFVAAYRWVRPGHALGLEIHRFREREVLAAVAIGTTLRTRVGEDGRARTRLETTIRNTDRQFLPVTLPGDSTLWGALVGGAPVKPLVDGRTVLVPLPTSGGGTNETAVVLVYETRLPPLEGKAELDLDPPDLAVAGTSFRWEVHLPDGYDVLRTDGAYRREESRKRPILVRWLEGLGDLMAGVDFSPLSQKGADSAAPGAAEAPVAASKSVADLEQADEDETVEAMPAPKPVADPAAPADMPPEPEEDPGEPVEGGERWEYAPDSAKWKDISEKKNELREDFGARAIEALQKGILSMDIGVAGGGTTTAVAAAGPAGSLTLVYRSDSSRDTWRWFLAAAVLLAGLLIVRTGLVGAGAFCVGLGALASTAPLLFDAVETALWDGVFLGAFACGMLHLGAWLVRRAKACAGATAVVLLVLLPAATARAGGSGPAPAPVESIENVERVFAPYDPADLSSLEKIEKVIVPYERFVELWNRAHPDRAIVTPEAIPVDVVLTGARYEGAVNGDFVLLTATFGLWLPRDRRTEVGLALTPAALDGATLDGAPTLVASKGKGLVAVVETAGHHTLVLQVRVRVDRKGPRGALRLGIPVVPRSSVDVTVPGTDLDVTVTAEGGVEGSEADGRTRVRAAIGSLNALVVSWGPKGPRRDGSLSVTASSRAVTAIRTGHADLRVETKLAIEGGRLSELTCDLTEGLVIRKVLAPHLLDWSQEGTRLTLRFRPPAETAVAIRFEGGVETVGEDFAVPMVAPLGVLREAGVVGVHASPGLTLVPTTVRALERTTFDEKALVDLAPGGYGPRRLAYRFSRRPVALTVAVGRTSPELVAEHRTHLHVLPEAVLGRTDVTFHIRDRIGHDMSLDVPAGIEIDDVLCDGMRTWWLDPAEEGRRRLTVTLARATIGKKVVSVLFRMPAAEGDDLVLPAPWPIGVVRSRGLVLLGASRSLDLTVTSMAGLRAASAEGVKSELPGIEAPRFAYRHDGGPWGLSAARKSRPSRMRPRIQTRLVVYDDKVAVDTLLTVEVLSGGVKSVRVFVPGGEGEDMIWAVEGLRDRTTAPGTVDGVEGTVHTLTFQAEVTAAAAIRALYERKIGEGPMTFRGVRLLGGEAGRSFVVIENRSDLVVAPGEDTGLTACAPADLPFTAGGSDATIFSHSWTAREETWSLGLSFRRFAFEEFDAAIVTMASLVTVVSPEGWSRNRMTYRVLNRSLQYLEVSLPAGASLEAALVGGLGVKPAAREPDDGRILIPLRRTALGELATEVVLVYVHDLGKKDGGLAALGSLEPLAPVLHDLPLQETYWEVRLPEGLDYGFDGNMEEVEADTQEAQKVLALWREQTILSEVESTGTESQKARAGANRIQTAVEIDRLGREVQTKLRSSLDRALDEKTKNAVATKLAELNKILDDNYTSNFSRDQARQEAVTRYQPETATAQQQDGARQRIPVLGDAPVLGEQFRKSAQVLQKKQAVARGKAGLLKESWTSNTVRPQQEDGGTGGPYATRQQRPSGPGGGYRGPGGEVPPNMRKPEDSARPATRRPYRGPAGEVAPNMRKPEDPPAPPGTGQGQAGSSARDLARHTRAVAGVPILTATINPTDLGPVRGLRVAGGAVTLTTANNIRIQGGRIVTHGGAGGVLDDITSGLDNAGGAATQSGVFFNDGADGDIRSRTEQIFEQTANVEDFDVQIAQAARIGVRRDDRRVAYGYIGVGGGAGGAGGGAGGAVLLPARRAGVLSLDVPLPAGGRVFRFRKENGSPELEIAVSDPASGRGWRGLLWLTLALGAFVAIRALDRRRIFPGFRAAVAMAIALLVMVLYGAVVVGLLVLIVAANVLFFTARRAHAG